MTPLYHRLIEKRKHDYTRQWILVLEKLLSSSDCREMIHRLSNAIIIHANCEDVDYMLSYNFKPNQFTNTLSSLLHHGILSLPCLELCILHVAYGKPFPLKHN